jgi:hypothetical protein
MQLFTIPPPTEPQICFRVDTFVVPETARAELEATLRRNMDFIRTLPGFRGHVAFEKSAGPSTFDLVTVAAWQDRCSDRLTGARGGPGREPSPCVAGGHLGGRGSVARAD